MMTDGMDALILWAIIESLRADGFEVTEIERREQDAGDSKP